MPAENIISALQYVSEIAKISETPARFKTKLMNLIDNIIVKNNVISEPAIPHFVVVCHCMCLPMRSAAGQRYDSEISSVFIELRDISGHIKFCACDKNFYILFFLFCSF